MTINTKKKYDEFLKKFVNENLESFLNSPKYRTSKSATALDYIPERGQTAQPGFIGGTAQFRKLTLDFFDEFIIKEDPSFNLNGHYKDFTGKLSDYLDKRGAFSKEHIMINVNHNILIDLFHAFFSIRDNVEAPYYFMFAFDDNYIDLPSLPSCKSCGTYLDLSLNFTKNEITISEFCDQKPCVIDKKVKTINVALKTPSGKLVFLNNPKEFFTLKREGDGNASINSTLGCIQETSFHAEHNIGFFFIGNTGIYIMQKEGQIIVTNYDDDEEGQVKKLKDYEIKGRISTNLWWYTILDYDLYIELCKKNKIDPNSITHTVVETNSPKCKISHKMNAHDCGGYYGRHSTIKY